MATNCQQNCSSCPNVPKPHAPEAMPVQKQPPLKKWNGKMIQKALDTCNGNLSAVAAQLGITRQTLYNKMKKFGL